MENSYKNYRQALLVTDPPCIPYLYVEIQTPCACAQALVLADQHPSRDYDTRRVVACTWPT